jgi:hypothetical protein
MSEKIKGILIDPFTKTITEIELTKPLLKPLYRAISCELIDSVALENIGSIPHDVVIDDEGLYVPGQQYFRMAENAPYTIFAGRGVIVSTTRNGDWESHQLDVETIKSKVQFLNKAQALEVARELDI